MRLVELSISKTLIAKQYNTKNGNLYNFLNKIKHIIKAENLSKIPSFYF